MVKLYATDKRIRMLFKKTLAGPRSAVGRTPDL